MFRVFPYWVYIKSCMWAILVVQIANLERFGQNCASVSIVRKELPHGLELRGLFSERTFAKSIFNGASKFPDYVSESCGRAGSCSGGEKLTFWMTSGVPKSLPPCSRKPQFGAPSLLKRTLIIWACIFSGKLNSFPTGNSPLNSVFCTESPARFRSCSGRFRRVARSRLNVEE